MFELLIYLILIVFSIEATTEIVSKSEFFYPVRKFLFEHKRNKVLNFLHNLLDCPYCTSVWVSFFYVLLFYFILTGSYVAIILPMILTFHRLANITHFVIDRINRGLL